MHADLEQHKHGIEELSGVIEEGADVNDGAAISEGEEVEAAEDVEASASNFSLKDLPWDVRFTREFKDQFVALKRQPQLQLCVFDKIRRLAHGEQGKSLMKQLKGTPKSKGNAKSLKIFESPCKTWKNSGRILWQYCVDYSPRIKVRVLCFIIVLRA